MGRHFLGAVLHAVTLAAAVALAACGGSPGGGSSGSAPTITSQPGDATVTAGETASYSVAAAGSPAPSYQWRRNGVDIPGATLATYVTPSLALADGGVSYSVVVSNSLGSATSSDAALAVRPGSTTDKLNMLRLLVLDWEYYLAASAPLLLVETDGLSNPTFGDPAALCGSGTVTASFNGGAIPVGQAVPLSGTLAASFNACDAGQQYTGSTSLQATLSSLDPLSGVFTVSASNMRARSLNLDGSVDTDVTVNGSASLTLSSSYTVVDAQADLYNAQLDVTIDVADGSTLHDGVGGLTAVFASGTSGLHAAVNADGSGSVGLVYDQLAITVSGVPYRANGSIGFTIDSANNIAHSGEIVFSDAGGATIGRIYTGSQYNELLIEVDGVTYPSKAVRARALRLPGRRAAR